jgi:hypothetical protein
MALNLGVKKDSDYSNCSDQTAKEVETSTIDFHNKTKKNEKGK